MEVGSDGGVDGGVVGDGGDEVRRAGGELLEAFLGAVDSGRGIAARRLAMAEASRVGTVLDGLVSGERSGGGDPEVAEAALLHRQEEVLGSLLTVAGAGIHFAGDAHRAMWAAVVEHLANPPGHQGRRQDEALYPAVLLFLGACVAAVAGGQWDALASLATGVNATRMPGYERGTIIDALFEWEIPSTAAVHVVYAGRFRTPAMRSEHLMQALRAPLSDIFLSPERYEACFRRVEYLLTLIHADRKEAALAAEARKPQPSGAPAAAVPERWKAVDAGLFFYVRVDERWSADDVDAEIAAWGAHWPPLRAGLFGGSMDRLRYIKGGVDSALRQTPVGRRAFLR